MTPRTRLLLIGLVFALLAAACGSDVPSELADDLQTDDTATTDASDDETQASDETPPPDETTTSATTEGETPVPPPVPDPSFAAVSEPSDPGTGCVGTRIGLSCLIDGEWENFDSSNSPIFEWVQEIDICDDGRIMVGTVNGIGVYDNGAWGEIEIDFGVSKPSAIACGDGVIWAGFFGSVGVFADGAWTTWNTEEVLGVTEFVKGVDDIVLAPDGTAFVATASSLARHQDGVWTVWEEGNGLDRNVSPDALTIAAADDGSYVVHASTGLAGLGRFVDETWTFGSESLNGADAIAESDGTLYVPAFRAGVTRFRDGVATDLGIDAGVSSDTVRDVATDDAGNVWLATAYGLTVIVDGEARTYRVDNSEIVDNDTHAVAVAGNGPTLPADIPEEWATVAGVALDETGGPLSDAPLELCVEDLRDEFAGASPCELQPYRVAAQTDDEGRFEAVGVRPGRYTITMQVEDGWTYFTDGSTAARYDAPSGETTELGVFEIGAEPTEDE